MLIHIGYPKSASSFLQQRIFINSNGFQKVCELADTRDILIKPYELYYDKSTFEKHVRPEIDKALAKNKLPILSFERLAGNTISGGYDQVTICNRLKELFPKAKIILIFREQSGYIVSSYKQKVNEGYAGTITEYIYPPEVGTKVPQFTLKFFEYSHLIKLYRKNFGDNNVLALPYELLKNKPPSFFSELFEFCELPQKPIKTNKRINPAKNALQIRIRAFTNAFFAKDQTNPTPVFPSPFLSKVIKRLSNKLPPLFEKKIEKRFHEVAKKSITDSIRKDNAVLSKITGIDLRELGYEVMNPHE